MAMGCHKQYLTPSRFTRLSESRTWSTGNSSPDAICFSVDRPNIFIGGVCVFCGTGTYEYNLELLEELNTISNHHISHSSERWGSVDSTTGTFCSDDAVMDVVELKFPKPIPLKVSLLIFLCFFFLKVVIIEDSSPELL